MMAKPRTRRASTIKRSSKEDGRYREIIEGAAKVFSQHGYAATSIQDIADELDFTSAALYYYIHAKSDLLVDICLWAGEEFEADMQEALAGLTSPVEMLHRLCIEHLRLIHKNASIFRIMLQERSHLPPKERRKVDLAERRYYKLVQSILEDGKGSGNFILDDTVVAASSLLGSLNWTLRWYRQRGSLSLEDVGEQIFALFHLGIASSR